MSEHSNHQTSESNSDSIVHVERISNPDPDLLSSIEPPLEDQQIKNAARTQDLPESSSEGEGSINPFIGLSSSIKHKIKTSLSAFQKPPPRSYLEAYFEQQKLFSSRLIFDNILISFTM